MGDIQFIGWAGGSARINQSNHVAWPADSAADRLARRIGLRVVELQAHAFGLHFALDGQHVGLKERPAFLFGLFRGSGGEELGWVKTIAAQLGVRLVNQLLGFGQQALRCSDDFLRIRTDWTGFWMRFLRQVHLF